MSTSSRDAPTALVFTGLSAEEFLIFDRQTKRWLRRKCKGLTKWFWDGTPPEITDENAKEICAQIYTSLLKTNPSYAVKARQRRGQQPQQQTANSNNTTTP